MDSAIVIKPSQEMIISHLWWPNKHLIVLQYEMTYNLLLVDI